MFILKSFWKPISWAVVVLFLSLISGNEVNKISLMQIPHIDKVAHFGMYFVFTFLLMWDFRRYKKNRIPWSGVILYSLLIAISFGGMMELFQEISILHRSTDIKDFIANSIGACTAAVIFPKFNSFFLKAPVITKPKNARLP